MITLDEVRQILQRLSLENGIANEDWSDDELNEDISCIVYRIDALECGDTVMIDRHVDIEYSYGECYEIGEDSSLFPFICTLCDLPLPQEEQEIIIWQK